MNNDFGHIVQLIQQSRSRAFAAVNAELINLYWQVGGYISHRVAAEEWGKGIVTQLAQHIARTEPSVRGFSDKNLWRMKQFYETYADTEILTAPGRQLENESKPNIELQDIAFGKTLLAQLSWSHHVAIIGSCKSLIEREFYIRLAVNENYSFRELQRQIASSLFERVALSKIKLSTLSRELQANPFHGIKDSYVFEFLHLPEQHSEKDLQKAIIQNLKQFLLEFSRDFAFMGEEFPVQVGSKDFALDLLFFNRSLNCLVAIELKVVDFIPEHLGKLNFYLEALDRDVKKPHEAASIGILLCKAKDDEVVEYAMSRQLSPAMVAQYQLQLPDKKLLQAKLNEFFMQNEKHKD